MSMHILLEASQTAGISALLPEVLRREAILRAMCPFTMVGRKRLEFLYDAAEQIDREQIDGDIVQCGVCNGGSAVVAGHAVGSGSSPARKLFLFDSFEGLPPPAPEDGEKARGFSGACRGNRHSVELALRIAGVDRSRVHIVPGWFVDTFPFVSIGSIAMLTIDADWYHSVRLSLEKFYDAVSPGGFIYLDDYGYWEGCRKATDEFLALRTIGAQLIAVDDTGHYFRKPSVRRRITCQPCSSTS